MRAIFIEEDRFSDLTDALRLKEQDKRCDNIAERLGWPLDVWHAAHLPVQRARTWSVVPTEAQSLNRLDFIDRDSCIQCGFPRP